MSEHPGDDSTSTFADHLEHERSASAPRAAREAVLRRLEASLPGFAAASLFEAANVPEGQPLPRVDLGGHVRPRLVRSVTSLFGAPLVRGAALLMVGGGVGAAAHAGLSSPRVVIVDRVIASSSATAAPDRSRDTVPVASLPEAPPPAASSGRALSATTQLDRESTLAVERGLLDSARSAMMRGEPADAERILRQHEARFPRGELREEREALVIKALVRTGRIDEARELAEHFRREFPSSLLLMGIDAELR